MDLGPSLCIFQFITLCALYTLGIQPMYLSFISTYTTTARFTELSSNGSMQGSTSFCIVPLPSVFSPSLTNVYLSDVNI